MAGKPDPKTATQGDFNFGFALRRNPNAGSSEDFRLYAYIGAKQVSLPNYNENKLFALLCVLVL